jgi:S1-C subfamily serine protease
MATAKKSLYEILGVPRDANSIDVGLAYERRRDELAKRVPPDAAETALAQQAYEVLSSPARRAQYDASLVTAAEKAAAAEQAPDLLLEPEPKAAPRAPIWIGAFAGAVVIAAALYFTFHSDNAVPPGAAPPKPAAKAPPPPPPQPLPPATILAGITSSVGQVLSYEMSGQAHPIGLAVAIDRGVFATTCHGIGASSALVVRIGIESHSATLAMTDEQLDLCKLAVPDIKTGGLAPASDEPKAGDKLYVVGANAKGEMALTEAKVKQLRPSPLGKVVEIDVPIAPTASGGAVVDAFGRLVGVATTPHAFGVGLNIVLPAAWFYEMRSRTQPSK